jgi:hypothetical protein
VYLLVGFFGAAWLGHHTRGNILQNQLLGGGWGQAAMNLIMAGERQETHTIHPQEKSLVA